MKLLFLAAALGTTMLGGMAIAQDVDPAQRGPHGMLLTLDANHDGTITRAEVTTQADRQFALLDVNKDGQISRQEIDELRQALGSVGGGHRGGRHHGGPGGPGMPPPPPPVAGGPQAGTTPPPPPPGGPGMRGPGGRGGMIERLDSNKDGTISRDEFRARALAMFDRLDSSKDGKIDAATLEGRMHGGMEGGRGGGHGWGNGPGRAPRDPGVTPSPSPTVTPDAGQ